MKSAGDRLALSGELPEPNPLIAIDWERAAMAMEAVSKAYKRAGRIGELRAGEHRWRSIHMETRFAGDLLIVAVPGTQVLSPGDWLLNLSLGRRRIPHVPGWWRSGFNRAGRWVWSRVSAILSDPHNQRTTSWARTRVMLTGHSLGGSVVLNAAARAKADGWGKRIEVYAAGAPRCTTADGARYVDGMGWRFVHGADPVPWAVLPLGWRHALPPVYFGADGLADPPGPWRRLQSLIRIPFTIGDHGMDWYVDDVRRVRDQQRASMSTVAVKGRALTTPVGEVRSAP